MVPRPVARASAACLLLVAAGLAQTADAQNYDGSGLLRFGAFVQGQWLHLDVTQAGAPVGTTPIDGLGGGVSAGYDRRFGPIVLGIEADISADDATETFAGNIYSLDYLVTARGRLGLLLHPAWMIYATGGAAWLGGEFKGNANVTKTSETLQGWTFGGGTEIDIGGFILFAEYLHTDYDRWSFTSASGTAMQVDADGDIARIGLKFKIGQDHDYDLYRIPK